MCFLFSFGCYTEDEVIQDFLWVDSCAKLADKVNLIAVNVLDAVGTFS